MSQFSCAEYFMASEEDTISSYCQVIPEPVAENVIGIFGVFSS